jgi:hypothetical protein
MVQSNHLYLLFKVFSRRGCGWNELGGFLTYLFRDADSNFRLTEMDRLACRHGSGQRHDLTLDWPQFKMCSVSGTFDIGKHRKIVARTVRELARQWIARSIPHAIASPLSNDEEEQEASANETPDDMPPASPGAIPTIADAFSSSFATGASSPQGPAVRTGMRVHHLTYLLGVWERAERAERAFALRTAAMELEGREDIEILHLCGCGLCLNNATKADGCVEPSHLRAGDKAENGLHTQYHSVLRQTSSANYRLVRRAIRDDCQGGFGLL